MLRYNRMKHLNPNPDRIRAEFWQGEPTYGRLFSLFHEHYAEHVGKPRWGDKSLHTEHYVDRVMAEFPNAKIIHMARDPRDRYASVRKRHGKDRQRVGASTGRYLHSMRMAVRNQKRYPDNYMIVQYEHLATKPEQTLRKICSFINEEFTPVMLGMGGASEYRDSGGNSSFDAIAPGVISTKSIGRYRQVISNHEIAFIQIFAGRVMESLGYAKEPVQLSLRERLEFYAVVMPVNLARMLGWLTHTTIKIKKGEPIPTFRLLQGSNPSPV
jgi:hypothetical protein